MQCNRANFARSHARLRESAQAVDARRVRSDCPVPELVNFPLYITLFAGALLICGMCAAAAGTAKRSCPDCGRATPLDKRRCRYCGYLLGRV